MFLVDPRNLTLKFGQNKVSDRLNIVIFVFVFVFHVIVVFIVVVLAAHVVVVVIALVDPKKPTFKVRSKLDQKLLRFCSFYLMLLLLLFSLFFFVHSHIHRS